jgi:D,D-heptose 1,7-bisphosphate phosphatase
MHAPTVRQAVVLAGGLGSRLGVLASSTPKPLLTCGDRPFLAWVLRELSRFGVEEVVLLTGHLADAVEATLPVIAAGLPKPLRIICNREERPAGTGGALFHARKHLADRFLLCNGDSWQDFNLGRLLADAARDPAETIGRIVLRHLDNTTRYGVVETDGDRITAFRERGGPGKRGMINAGLYVLDRRVLDEAAPICSLERDIMPALASRGVLRGTVADGYFVDIGLPADLERAQTELPARLLRRALFLDRDGVINLDRGWVGTRERFTFVPGALTAIRAASDTGWHVFVVTNQSGIARGLYDESQFVSLCSWMIDAIRAEGGTIDDLRYCPFHPEAPIETYRRFSSWRKPAPGMLLDLLARWQLNPARCLLIGDRHSDLVAAAAAGIPAHLFPVDGDLTEFLAPLLRRAPEI